MANYSTALKLGTNHYIHSFSKKLKRKHAFIGEEIIFNRKGQLVEAVVVDYRENTVIAEITAEAALNLEIDNNLTVVNHKNYDLVR